MFSVLGCSVLRDGFASMTMIVLSPMVMFVVSGTTCASEEKVPIAISRHTKPKRIISCLLSSDITEKLTTHLTGNFNFEHEVTNRLKQASLQ